MPESAPNLPNTTVSAYRVLPLAFAPNRGQGSRRSQFVARGAGYDVALERRRATLTFGRGNKRETLSLRLEQAAARPVVQPERRLAGRVNYLLGSDLRQWRTDIPMYGSVRYRRVWPGIDTRFHGRAGSLEYDFLVLPGADPGRIGLGFGGARSLSLDRRGDLVLRLRSGTVREHRPRAWQRVDGRRRSVSTRYALVGSRRVALQVGRYDPRHTLIIDPVLSFSTYLTGTGRGDGSDEANGVVVDASGNAYVVGTTGSDFLTGRSYRRNPSSTLGRTGSVFVAKFRPDGRTLAYLTYLDGGGADIAVDRAGSAYVVGGAGPQTRTAHAFQPGYGGGGSDAYVAKLSPEGNRLQYASYLGGAGEDDAVAVAVDAAGSAYVTGSTTSENFPTAHALQPHGLTAPDAPDAFVAKIAPDGGTLAYSSYVAGTDADRASDIAVDSAGSAYVTGSTRSSDFPTARAFQPAGPPPRTSEYSDLPEVDAFIAKLTPDGSALAYSTFFGGVGDVYATAVAVDGDGSAYITGWGGEIPIANAYQAHPLPWSRGGGRAELGVVFVTKLVPAGDALAYSTYLGGGDSGGSAIAVDARGRAYVAGQTDSPTFPMVDAYEPRSPGGGVFVTRLTPDGHELSYSTYLSGGASATGIAVDASGGAYVTGRTTAKDFATEYAFQPRPGRTDNGADGFLVKLAAQAPRPLRLTITPRRVRAGRPACFRFVANSRDRRARGITIRFAGRITKTHSAGDTSVCAVLKRGNHAAVATGPGYQRVSVRVAATGTYLRVGESPSSIAIGDLNSDGRPDLVGANEDSNDVSVLLGRGRCHFARATAYQVHESPMSIAIGDLNGDRRPDLAVANYQSEDVSVLLGRGGGRFGRAAGYRAHETPSSVAIGDLNGDGRQDLAVANERSDDVSVLLGRGGGRLGRAANYQAHESPSSVAIGDLNGDGRQDLAVACEGSAAVSVLLGRGGGRFGRAVRHGTAGAARSVVIADMDGDRRRDLVTANGDTGDIAVLLGRGGGRFARPASFLAHERPVSVATADFNGDGRPDIAAANSESNDLSVLLGVRGSHSRLSFLD